MRRQQKQKTTTRTALNTEFDNEEEEYNSGVNLPKSKFGRKNTADAKKNFDKQIEDYVEYSEGVKKRAFDLSTSFMSLINDKTLKKNKGPIQENLEKDTVRQLIDICLEINNDHNQPEGMGSAGVLILLLKTTLIQKDTINELSYKMLELEKRIAELEKSREEK